MSKKKRQKKAVAPPQLNVLVLERDSDDARLLERQLLTDSLPARIFTAIDRESFLLALDQAKFDLILADYNVPGITGMSALKIAMEKCPEAPFIFVSGKMSDERLEETLRQGAAEYLKKGEVSKLILSATRALREKTIRNGDYKLGQDWSHFLVGSDDLLALLDVEGNFKLLSPSWQKVLGFKPEELLDRSLKPFVHSDDRARFAEALQSVLEQRCWSGELVQLTKTGVRANMQTRWTLLRDVNGAPKSILYIATDLTEKKQLEAEFLRMQRLENVGALASGIAHDLNNVLAPILMAAGLIDPAGSAQKNAHLLEIVKSNAQRGAELIKQILSFTRGQDPARTVISVESVLSEVTRMLRHTFPKSIDIRAVLPKGVPPIEGDLTQLHQILINLCVNARDAMAEGGTLLIEVSSADLKAACTGVPEDIPAGRYTLIKISDTGCGIEPENLGKIFEPFFTTKPVEQRNGLGLFTVRKLVAEHSGFVRVISEIDKGTRFELYFPALKEQTAKAQRVVPIAELPCGKGETVLVVDDERAMLEIVEAILIKFGYKVVVAANGVEALSLFAKHKSEIRLVIIDIMMPLLDGAATIAALQRISPHIDLIGISGLATNERLCRLFPRTQFLQKPFSLDRLLAAVKHALSEVPAPMLSAAAA